MSDARASTRKSVKGAERFSERRRRRPKVKEGASAPGPCDQTKTIRIDKWLFHARLYKTRPLAQAAAAAGKVRLNGRRVEKPAQAVRLGDILTLGRGKELLVLKILALAERRGPAPEARQLYEIVA